MKTRRVISNITWNSLDFFELKINDLYNDEIIEWAYWILHEPDTDDLRWHIHFVLKPSRSIDTFELTREFYEFPFHGNRLPKKPTAKYKYVVSMQDWLLYAIHHEDYLASKGMERNIHYDFSCIHSTDNDALINDINEINYNNYGQLALLSKSVCDNIPFAQLIQKGKIPIAYRAQYEAQYKALVNLRETGLLE